MERPKGTNDFLYPESKIRQLIINEIIVFLEKFGYLPIETPIFEYVELFRRSAGISSDIVSKEMYEFSDRKGRRLVLRPEITAPVVRSIIQNNLLTQKLIKLYYVGSIFRYEKPQKDRYRQATQLGIEYFGQENYLADIEVIYITHKIYTKFNLDVEIHINSIGCTECRPIYREKLYNYFSEREDKLCIDCKRRLQENPLRILDCKLPSCKELSINAPKPVDYLCPNCAHHFSKILENLPNEIKIKQNPLLVRGLDYYNRTVFEVKYENVDLAGGGRYDYLVSLLTNNKHNLPAIGFALGLERLTNILIEKKLIDLQKKSRINLCSLDDKADKIILDLYTQLVENVNNQEMEIFLTKFGNLSKALKAADQKNINYIVFIGKEELESNQATIRNMLTGKQEKISLSNLINHLKEIQYHL